MSLELKRNKDGSLRSAYWYGRYTVNGKKHCSNLDVQVQGTVPRNLRTADEELDPKFLESRKEAEKSLERHMREARSGKTAAALARKVYEIEAGSMLGDVKISSLPDRWISIPRRHQTAQKHLHQGRSVVGRFVDFVKETHPKLKKAGQVTPDLAMAFMRAESDRGISNRTWNYSLGTMKSLFTHLQQTLGLIFNPFASITSRIGDSVSREPFTQEDLDAIMDAAKTDPELYPVIVTAVCTAMRRGDCCLLKWKHVDLKANFIAVKTAKTGELVEIPILPLLHDVLSQLPQTGQYVFPSIAKTFQRDAIAINHRLSVILEKAGFVDSDKVERARKLEEKRLPEVSSARLLSMGLKAIDESQMEDAKRERMLDCFRRYHSGQTIPVIAQETGLHRLVVSVLLNELERKLEVAVIRRKFIELPAKIRGEQRVAGEGKRKRRVAVKGWHSFRTTWITMALSAGVPEELVRRVSGHTSVDVVRKHYFRPGREQFKQAMVKAMPAMLTNGQKTPKEQALEVIDKATAKTWRQALKQVRELIALM